VAAGGYTLAIEISNPSSGPRGVIPGRGGKGEPVLAGPGVALGTAGGPGVGEHLGTELLHEGTRHDDDLMPAIDRLFGRFGLSPRDLGAVAVSIGPGGYTSLRIAVATAKMLAEATGARTIPVPSASVAAWHAPFDLAPAIVCLASKGEAAYGVLLPPGPGDPWWSGPGAALAPRRSTGGAWIAAAIPLGMMTAAEIDALRPRGVIGDRFLPLSMRAAAERAGARIEEPVFAARSVLQIAASAGPVDPLALAPMYAREAEAVTQWRRRKGGGG
jgi:tRNA threonylcarbamoyladenosine biosynthesis protein TsaB